MTKSSAPATNIAVATSQAPPRPRGASTRLWLADLALLALWRPWVACLWVPTLACQQPALTSADIDALRQQAPADANTAQTDMSPPPSFTSVEAIRALLAAHDLSDLADGEVGRVAINPEDTGLVASLVWQKYADAVAATAGRRVEDQQNAIAYGDLTMRYSVSTIGAAPADGHSLFIALHGGGNAAASANDDQWRQMQTYYLGSVQEGIYVAPRGITNTYDLHSRPQSYVMYDRLIENMIVLRGVNPQRVYVLGYSAGGDGTYQIAARMTDRFAAANMSAGHPNNLDLRNIGPLPMALQVGELDSAYDRNKVTVQYGGLLDSLQAASQNRDYRHVLWVHYNLPHNFTDNSAQHVIQSVLARPQAWLTENDRSTTIEDTSAVPWLAQYSRVARPQRLRWDLNTWADRSAAGFAPSSARGRQYYWLDRGDYSPQPLDVAVVSRLSNKITIATPAPPVDALLDHTSFDLSQPIEICRDDDCRLCTVTPSLQVLVQTLLDRGDPTMMFSARVSL